MGGWSATVAWIRILATLMVATVVTTLIGEGFDLALQLWRHSRIAAHHAGNVQTLTRPVHAYITAHATGLPTDPGTVWALWQRAAPLLLLLALTGQIAARLAWCGYGGATAAAVDGHPRSRPPGRSRPDHHTVGAGQHRGPVRDAAAPADHPQSPSAAVPARLELGRRSTAPASHCRLPQPTATRSPTSGSRSISSIPRPSCSCTAALPASLHGRARAGSVALDDFAGVVASSWQAPLPSWGNSGRQGTAAVHGASAVRRGSLAVRNLV